MKSYSCTSAANSVWRDRLSAVMRGLTGIPITNEPLHTERTQLTTTNAPDGAFFLHLHGRVDPSRQSPGHGASRAGPGDADLASAP
jgi:hypothetical protein